MILYVISRTELRTNSWPIKIQDDCQFCPIIVAAEFVAATLSKQLLKPLPWQNKC